MQEVNYYISKNLNKYPKITKKFKGNFMQNASEQSAHMFIVNPFGSLTSKLGVLFRTHPSTSDRIAELQRLEQEIKRGM